MAKSRLSEKALYVERGYGQVEPNHLSAQRTGQIYAQLPAKDDIAVLENGQFVKYNYADGVVDFDGPGEWMLVFNEVKLYRDHLDYNDFAMIATDYVARVYSPVGELRGIANARNYQDVVTPADPYEPTSTENPFTITQWEIPKFMPEGTRMVPRVFKTNVGDLFTTNCIAEEQDDVALGDTLVVGDDGYLCLEANAGDNAGDMAWQVVKVYTLPDRQKAVKVMRIA